MSNQTQAPTRKSAKISGADFLAAFWINVEAAARRHGATDDEIDKLGSNDRIEEIGQLIARKPVIPPNAFIVNLDSYPRCPVGWKVESHKNGGKLDLAKARIDLYLSPKQQEGGGLIGGNTLHEHLSDKPVLNANLLDFYLANPSLIPEHWAGNTIFFWNTTYRDSVGQLCVRGMYWSRGEWYWCCRSLVYIWGADNPAAVLAS